MSQILEKLKKIQATTKAKANIARQTFRGRDLPPEEVNQRRLLLAAVFMIAGVGALSFRMSKSVSPKADVVLEKIQERTVPVRQIASVKVQNSVGLSHYRNKDYGKAEEVFKQLHERRPNHPGILINLGMVSKMRGNLGQAKTYFLKAIENDPKSAVAYNNLGSLSADQENWDEAITHFQRAVELSSGDLKPLLNLARAYESTHRWSEALGIYKAYLTKPNRDQSLSKLIGQRVGRMSAIAGTTRKKGEL